MEKQIYSNKQELGAAAAARGIQAIKKALGEKGYADIILATGASQFEMLAELVKADIDWSKVTAFHLDEYIGLPPNHPASFAKYLKERFADKVKNLKEFHYINPDAAAPEKEAERVGTIISSVEIDVAFIGIGENGHLAFNDPPADFTTEVPYLVVELDEPCRRQQLGEGWFESLEVVPKKAISMSVQQILKSRQLICTVPDKRKAEAVRCAVKGKVSPDCPSSILQTHPDCALLLDTDSASLIQ